MINPVAGETLLLATFMARTPRKSGAKFLASIPIGRFSTPADIASAACFLWCSDEAFMITGVALEVMQAAAFDALAARPRRWARSKAAAMKLSRLPAS